MKHLKLALADDGSVFLQVKGDISGEDIIRASAMLMAKSIKIGLARNVIRESEIDSLYTHIVDTSKKMLSTEWKEEEYERFAKAHHEG